MKIVQVTRLTLRDTHKATRLELNKENDEKNCNPFEEDIMQIIIKSCRSTCCVVTSTFTSKVREKYLIYSSEKFVSWVFCKWHKRWKFEQQSIVSCSSSIFLSDRQWQTGLSFIHKFHVTKWKLHWLVTIIKKRYRSTHEKETIILCNSTETASHRRLCPESWKKEISSNK